MSLADLKVQTSAIGKINEAILDCVASQDIDRAIGLAIERQKALIEICLLYTSPSPRDGLLSRMPSSA